MKKHLLVLLLACCLITCSEDNADPEKTPKMMHITKIVVTKFPATTTNGGGWDLTSGPDIFPLLSKGQVTVYDSPEYFEDVTASGYTFTPLTSIEISSPMEEYKLSLFDYDSLDPDDLMGSVTFKPYEGDQAFPSEITLDTGGAVSFKLTVTYSF